MSNRWDETGLKVSGGFVSSSSSSTSSFSMSMSLFFLSLFSSLSLSLLPFSLTFLRTLYPGKVQHLVNPTIVSNRNEMVQVSDLFFSLYFLTFILPFFLSSLLLRSLRLKQSFLSTKQTNKPFQVIERTKTLF